MPKKNNPIKFPNRKTKGRIIYQKLGRRYKLIDLLKVVESLSLLTINGNQYMW